MAPYRAFGTNADLHLTDENVKFVFAVLKHMEGKIDFEKIALELGITKASASMRMTRLRKRIAGLERGEATTGNGESDGDPTTPQKPAAEKAAKAGVKRVRESGSEADGELSGKKPKTRPPARAVMRKGPVATKMERAKRPAVVVLDGGKSGDDTVSGTDGEDSEATMGKGVEEIGAKVKQEDADVVDAEVAV